MIFINRIVLYCGNKNEYLSDLLENMHISCEVIPLQDEHRLSDGDIVITDRYLFSNEHKRIFAYIIDEALDDFLKDEDCVITCGMSSNATVNISSKGEKNAVVSLQREIKNIFGQVIEPQDIVVTSSLRNEAFIIAAAAVAKIIVTDSNFQ